MARNNAHDRDMVARSERRFWVVVAVIMGLMAQVLFPPHLMAASPDGPGFVLCNTQSPALDTSLSQAVASEKNTKALQGLKCADCVAATLIGWPQPNLIVRPVVYSETIALRIPARPLNEPKARAPPRPHSCGPPALV